MWDANQRNNYSCIFKIYLLTVLVFGILFIIYNSFERKCKENADFCFSACKEYPMQEIYFFRHNEKHSAHCKSQALYVPGWILIASPITFVFINKSKIFRSISWIYIPAITIATFIFILDETSKPLVKDSINDMEGSDSDESSDDGDQSTLGSP